MTERKRLELVPRYLFLKKLRERYPIEKIYYPGSGSNKTLEENFGKDQIVYLDKADNSLFQRDAMSSLNNGHAASIRITADYTKSPFKDEVFDALFFEDNHADPEDFEEMLRTLKPGGLVIVGDTCWGGVSKVEALKTKNLKKVQLPFRHDADSFGRFIVLQKVQSGKCEVPGVSFGDLFEGEGFDLGVSKGLD